MRHLNQYLIFIILLLLPVEMMAQRGTGIHGGVKGSNGATSPEPVKTEPEEISDFRRLVAMQATDAQKSMLQSLALNIGLAIAKTSALQKINMKQEYTEKTSDQVRDSLFAVRKMNRNLETFLSSFTEEQKKGYKNELKKLNKAKDEATKQHDMLTQDHLHSPMVMDQLVLLTGNLNTALNGLKSEQEALTKLMGVESESSQAQLNVQK